ncbi:MAG: hypothetical protein BM557_04815 [Flavobacterium sp. MedPE-SWcel]|uniref:hypothetical protein n=1 Tax=uncultured Flavobacterium sp. TaxID=165435 RepID=UPI0009199545|nr:hypothetical protein [uncultured Flavobacterium sp.]OIQ21081.1 MAG: hypothetical protein BM557_04815 [Flavobacterium sp. MedPE-SWcel]
MAHVTFDRRDLGGLGGHISKEKQNYYGDIMPYEDPAIVNPDELATFPKKVAKNHHYYYHDHHHPIHIQSTPLRECRNITRTDNHPEKNGFM